MTGGIGRATNERNKRMFTVQRQDPTREIDDGGIDEISIDHWLVNNNCREIPGW